MVTKLYVTPRWEPTGGTRARACQCPFPFTHLEEGFPVCRLCSRIIAP